jgi:hypothetical protein
MLTLKIEEVLKRKNSINASWNFAIGNINLTDKDLFFQLKKDEHYEFLSEDTTMWNILIKLGIFNNNSQCKGAEIQKYIDEGFTSFIIGKKRDWITILKITK